MTGLKVTRFQAQSTSKQQAHTQAKLQAFVLIRCIQSVQNVVIQYITTWELKFLSYSKQDKSVVSVSF